MVEKLTLPNGFVFPTDRFFTDMRREKTPQPADFPQKIGETAASRTLCRKEPSEAVL